MVFREFGRTIHKQFRERVISSGGKPHERLQPHEREYIQQRKELRASSPNMRDMLHFDVAADYFREHPGQAHRLTVSPDSDSARGVFYNTVYKNIPRAEGGFERVETGYSVGSLYEGRPTARVEDLHSLHVISMNCAGLAHYQLLNGPLEKGKAVTPEQLNRNTEKKKELEKELLDTLIAHAAGGADVIYTEDIPDTFAKQYSKELYDAGLTAFVQVLGVHQDKDLALGRQYSYGQSLATFVNMKKLGSRYGVGLSNPAFIPHYQGTRKEDTGAGADKKVTTTHPGQNWEQNYARTDAFLKYNHVFGTQALDIVLRGVGGGERRIRLGNYYMSPPSYMAERGRSYVATLREVLAKEDALYALKNGDVAVVGGDANTYGYDSAKQYSVPWQVPAAITSAPALRRDKKEVRHFHAIEKRFGFTRAVSNMYEASITKMKDIFKLRLDHMAVSVVGAKEKDTPRVQTLLNKANFTDHKKLDTTAVVSRISFSYKKGRDRHS